MTSWNGPRHASPGSTPTSGWTTSTSSQSARRSPSKSTLQTPPSSSSQAYGTKDCASLPSPRSWHPDLFLPNRLASLLELEGENLKVATVGKDLGIDFSGGRTHRRLFHHKRARTAIQRIRRIRFIKKHKGPALKMTTAGFLPSISYGPSVLGVSTHEIKRMRREMCASALVHLAGRCPYTVSSIVYNRKDPLIAVGLSQLRTWWGAWDLFGRLPATHSASLAPYTSAHPERTEQQTLETYARPHRGHHRNAHGSWLGGPVARSLDLSRWHRVQLVRPLRSSPTPARFFSHFEATLWHDFWLAADNGYCGTGLAGGCDMTVLRRQYEHAV